MTALEQKQTDELLTHYSAVIRKLEHITNLADAVRNNKAEMDYDTVEAAKISIEYHKKYLSSITTIDPQEN